MPANPLNFAIPGLMRIRRPLLEGQRSLLTLPPHRIQDTLWAGIPSIGPVTPGGAQPTWPLTKVEMVFGESLPIRDGLVHVCADAPLSGQGTVVIEDPALWTFHLPPQPLPLSLGHYHWELRTTDSQATTTVHYAGTLLVTA